MNIGLNYAAARVMLAAMLRSVCLSLTTASLTLLLAACGNTMDSTEGAHAGEGGLADGSPGNGAGRPDATVGDGAASCGHESSSLCVAGQGCAAPSDSQSGVCTAEVCQAPTDHDGVKNGGETGIDCGGSGAPGSDDAPACSNGEGCSTGTDCVTSACQASLCVPASCSDGVKNEGETDIDCGGSCAPCAVGQGCSAGTDCTTKDCQMGSCQPATCTDKLQNGAETDTDCGGGTCPACADGQKCAAAADCSSFVCTANACQVPTDMDHVKNGTETDIDCGGGTVTGTDGAPACVPGQACLVQADCNAGVCTADVCQAPTFSDGVQNGGETDIDCGGAGVMGSDGAPPCGPKEKCVQPTDCNSSICASNVCTASSPTDHVKNGGETDIDCGGAASAGSDNAPPCPDAKSCALDGDCLSAFCTTGATKVCTDGQSCKASNGLDAAGIDTCGLLETGVTGAQHESCCKSLPMPQTKARLDKYEITAGRMRQFITAVGPNVQSWVTGQIAANTTAGVTLAAQIPAAAQAFLPTTDNPKSPLNLIIQLGSGVGVMNTDQPSDEQGCYIANGAYGAATYWQPDALLESYGLPARTYTQAQLDEKPMNCAPYWMMAAFCAWDGGALPTPDEQTEVWGTDQYPWGPDFLPNPYPTTVPVADFNTTVNYYNNTELFYHYPDYSGPQNHDDNSGYISAPGRFKLDATAIHSGDGEAWMDIGADMLEFAAHTDADGNGAKFCDYSGTGGTVTTECDYTDSAGTKHTDGVLRSPGLPASKWMGGSWEGHEQFSQTKQPFFAKVAYTFGMDVQYGKTDARCVRPAE